MFTASPSQDDIQTAVRSFLLSVLPPNFEVVEGQDNRVPEPKVLDFAVMWPLRRERLSTNIDDTGDVRFTASISGTLMSVTHIDFGVIAIGTWVFGVGVLFPTRILFFGSGTGGLGTYTLDQPQAVPSEIMSSGQITATQHTEVVLQIDVHGPTSTENAQVISTLFRDPYAVSWFAQNAANIMPLFADDPNQIPFFNAEDQTEYRWVVEAHLQANIALALPQQYADAVNVLLQNVDAVFPPV